MARTNNRLTNQGVWIGAGPGTEDAVSLFVPGQLGMVYIALGKVYQFVRFVSTTATIAAGTPVVWQDEDDFVVSSAIADSTRNRPAGIALGTQTAAYYGWIQVGGPHSAVLQASGLDFASGDTLVYGTTDGRCIRVAAGTASTYIPVGIATAASTSTAVAAIVDVPHNGW